MPHLAAHAIVLRKAERSAFREACAAFQHGSANNAGVNHSASGSGGRTWKRLRQGWESRKGPVGMAYV